jgi:hypothetical protein
MAVQLTMKELHQIHAFHSDTLAYRADVPEASVMAMLNNQPVPQKDAEKVLRALSEQHNRYYTLANVSVNLESQPVQERGR